MGGAPLTPLNPKEAHILHTHTHTHTHSHTAQTPINPKEAYILRVHCEDGVEDVGACRPPDMPANKKKPDAVVCFSTHCVHLHSICLLVNVVCTQ